jgi:hypothetical protein
VIMPTMRAWRERVVRDFVPVPWSLECEIAEGFRKPSRDSNTTNRYQ